MSNVSSRRYSVAVVATMSAGKSTLLNSMMCRDLLPSQNEACTATVFKIEDNDGVKHFSGRYKDQQGWSDWHEGKIDSQLLADWNEICPQEIELVGDLPNISNTPYKVKVCFIDTPGPNNARCENHAIITQRLLSENDFSTLCFVINCSVAGVRDEWQLLFDLKRQLPSVKSTAQIIFILNKIDLLDPEKGESIMQTVELCRKYLENDIGFKRPIIIPVCSKLALGIRSTIRTAKRLTKNQLCKLKGIKSPVTKNISGRRVRRMSNSYICTLKPRQQAELVHMLESFKDFAKNYQAALDACIELKQIIPEYKQRKIPLPTRKIYIHNRFYTHKELFNIDSLAGVAYVEKLIEKHCFNVVPGLSRSN